VKVPGQKTQRQVSKYAVQTANQCYDIMVTKHAMISIGMETDQVVVQRKNIDIDPSDVVTELDDLSVTFRGKYRLVVMNDILKSMKANDNVYVTWLCNKKKNKRNNDAVYKIRCNISTLIQNGIRNRGFSKKTKTSKILGCDYDFFKKYIEDKFKEGMTWENRSEWSLDHIIPVSLAKTEEELIKLNHYTNFQPLWKIENIKKGNKLPSKFTLHDAK
jgi:hypothetical protein